MLKSKGLSKGLALSDPGPYTAGSFIHNGGRSFNRSDFLFPFILTFFSKSLALILYFLEVSENIGNLVPILFINNGVS